MAKELVLELTNSEAQTLEYILGRVGGCPTNSPRKDADSIFAKLRDMSIRRTAQLNSSGNFQFHDIEKKVCGSCKRPL